MSRIIKKNVVRENTELNVGKAVYTELDEKVKQLLDQATERAEANSRKTLKARDV